MPDGGFAPHADGDLEGGVTMHVAGRRRAPVHGIARSDGEARHQSVHLLCHRRHDVRTCRNISCYKGNAEAIHIGRRLRLVVQGGMVATNPSGLGGFLGGDPAADQRLVQGGVPPSD
ncbi:MAG: hypothetical protein QOE89_737 [Pseudonocardiales bacterium]|nr:hypothetical protein [Pseudonocardiales bacterium]